MSILDLRVRYFQDSTPVDVPCREENFVHRHIRMPLSLSQTALVLVDVWNVHFIESWIERAERITRESVLPILDTVRQCEQNGERMTVVHAPSPPVAAQFEQLARHQKNPSVQSVSPSTNWPPAQFRQRSDEYQIFRGPRSQPPGIDIHWNKLASQLSISPQIEVKPEEEVIATGQQLHQLLAERQILHLIYVGFAINWCVLGRDYGIRAMAGRGYNIILLREATTGVEFPDTLDETFTTEIAVREVEQQYGFTASNQDFFQACRIVGGKCLTG